KCSTRSRTRPGQAPTAGTSSCARSPVLRTAAITSTASAVSSRTVSPPGSDALSEGRRSSMSTHELEMNGKDTVRVFLSGVCDGLPDLREALAKHPEVELVGSSDNVLEGAATLTGGHLQVVLHATRSATLPANDVAAIREYTRAPVILLASGGSPSLLQDAAGAGIPDRLLLPPLTHNVVFPL